MICIYEANTTFWHGNGLCILQPSSCTVSEIAGGDFSLTLVHPITEDLRWKELQEERQLTYLFISHDLSVVEHISDVIGVMYLGTMVELAESYELNRHPLHPYSQTLLSAVPVPDPEVSRSRQRIVLEGDIPSPMNPPSGCRFHTRCPYATEKCKQVVPTFKEYEKGHWVACHLLEE